MHPLPVPARLLRTVLPPCLHSCISAQPRCLFLQIFVDLVRLSPILSSTAHHQALRLWPRVRVTTLLISGCFTDVFLPYRYVPLTAPRTGSRSELKLPMACSQLCDWHLLPLC